VREGIPVAPVSEDGRLKLPGEAVETLGDAELEVEVASDEVRLRRRGDAGHG
jgi:hypothetical protein